MKVLFVASECSPFAKVGGLADVVSSLPKELIKNGTDASVIIPRHKVTRRFPAEKVCDITVELGWRRQYAGLLKTVYEGVTVYFIDNEYYFGGDNVYGFNEGEAEKYAFFSKAVIELLPHLDGGIPDIIHCNDWQTGLIPCLIKTRYHLNVKTVFTIHNLMHRGIYGVDALKDLLGFDDSMFTSELLEFYGGCSYLKAGLIYSDKITTVSETYRNETLYGGCGEGMEGVLQMRGNDYVGIVNGIGDEFSPETDTKICKNFTSRRLSGKKECKRALQEELGLPIDGDIPVFSVVTRLYDQKGIDLLADISNELLFSEKMQLVVLGTGDSRYERFFIELSQRFNGKVAVRLCYDDALARKIYAGSDFFLMPSRFEPCGLSQLIAMKYGTVPIVRACGGLNDTVVDFGDGGWGLRFNNYSSGELLTQIRRAVGLFKNKSEMKSTLVRAMNADFSWSESGKKYINLYNSLF